MGDEAHVIGKLTRTARSNGPCKIEGPITGETEKFYVVQVDWSDDRGGYVGPRRFRKANLGTFRRWGGTITHIQPCSHCADYVTLAVVG